MKDFVNQLKKLAHSVRNDYWVVTVVMARNIKFSLTLPFAAMPELRSEHTLKGMTAAQIAPKQKINF